MSSSAPRARSAPLGGSTTWRRIWSSITSAMRPLMAPRDDQMQHRCATRFLLECALDRLDLAAHAPDPIEQLHLLAFGVRHRHSLACYRVGGMVSKTAAVVEPALAWAPRLNCLEKCKVGKGADRAVPTRGPWSG